MEGLLLRGRLVSVEFPDGPDENGRWPFGNVTLQASKFDGEPYWQRAAFNYAKRDGSLTGVAEALAELASDTLVEVAVEAAASRSGGRVWFKAYRAAVVAEDVPVTQNGNRKRQAVSEPA